MLLPALLLIIASVFQLCAAQSTAVIDLGYAKYQGAWDSAGSNNTQFLGIRFAAPPTGSLRWQAPRTPDFVADIQNATAEPSGCLQAGFGRASSNPFPTSKRAASAADSEDCLFLNVYVPGQLDPRKSLPVVVWIHGGGYVSGSANGFSGNDLIHEAGGGVIAVVIQYRLGLFGFPSWGVSESVWRIKCWPSKWISNLHFSGSRNTWAAFILTFVAQFLLTDCLKIAKFGGDPSRVTIWGVSAGAGSVIQHIIANDGQTSPPLFRAAITSSSFLPSQYAYNDVIPEVQSLRHVKDETSCTSAANSLACLRNVDADVLEQINTDLCNSGFFGTFVFVPVVDGDFIKQRPTLALRDGKVNGEVVMSVTNTDEGGIFVDSSTAGTVQVPEYLAQLFPNLSSQHRDIAVTKYSGLGTPIEQVTAIMGEAIFVCPTYFLLRAFKGKTFKASSTMGQFAIPPGSHGSDVAYYFPSTNANGVPPFNNTDFDKAFAESFLAFIMSLDPNETFEPTITPSWEPFSFQQSHQVEMRFNRTEAGDPAIMPFTTPEDLLDRCSQVPAPTPFLGLSHGSLGFGKV
ncbi:Alpha/Beta hydrolase protein [Desarmillaria tabescens]|uniref:Carboxylic ester hydrolase n=1 Tax=Armillaria tabescens TaxID=1929756 RepID=A0AA39NDI1_ARMTA|nr:Alpha/Beta hydrolase protein [Desarmillaria tabescens]KAK0463611.1 Alpha/Beta hydrolase protein [Desarmillaria tabescens]